VTRGTTLLGTVLRGMRARALLSAGSVLLTALAIGSAVLGPIFQQAVTNSYLVTRLDEAPNNLTGLTWRLRPDRTVQGEPDAAVRRAVAAVRRDETGPFAAPTTTLETDRVPALGGIAMLLATDVGGGACAHLDVEGGCPQRPGEVLMLAGDLEDTGTQVGDRITLADPIGEVTVVGSYRVPSSEVDYWFDLARFASKPRQTNVRTGVTTPYTPAPFVTVRDTFASLPTSAWSVRVDRLLDAPPDLDLADLEAAQRAATALEAPAAVVAGGRLRGDSINDIESIAREARAQQRTARDSIAPAVVSLVLVALALLLRLLMAAADLRLPELALAALRGLPRRRLWALGLSEPLALLLLAIPAGGVIGVGLALGLARWWLVPGLPLPVPWTAALSGLLVAVAAVGVAVLAVGVVLRVSLSEQLTGVRRPQESSRTSLVAQLVLVAAALAVLASKLSAGGPGDPDVTDLVLPVLLAVVAGVAATRATAGAATWWTRRRRTSRSLAGFVAARAISRRREGTLVILPVTAAIAICVFGAGVFTSAGQWRESVAATAAPAPVVWTSPLPMNGTVALTHRLDPEGRWLMAASRLNTLGPTFTVVDTPRLSRVASWQDQWTPGTTASDITEALRLRADVPTLTGRRVGLTVDNGTRGGQDLYVRLRLVAAGEPPHFAFLGPFGPGESSADESVPYCRSGCALEAMTIGGPAALTVVIEGPLRIGGLVADGTPVEGGIDGAGWGRAPDSSAAEIITRLDTEGEELVLELDSQGSPAIVQLSSGALPEALPVVKGVDAKTAPKSGTFSSTSANEFSVDPVISAQSVPFLGPNGLLIDYTMLSTNRTVYEQNSTVYVLARADAPVAVTQGLQERGASVTTTLAGVQKTLDQSAYALALRLYAVVAALVLLMALAGLFVSTAVQLPARRRDAAALRVVGVPRRSVMSAVVRELAVVLGGTAVAGLAAGTLAQYVVLRTVTLGYVEDLSTPALIAAVDWQRLAILSTLTALVFGIVAVASAALTVRGARGATLRESAR
jgi:putative ABC transport system permease protein